MKGKTIYRRRFWIFNLEETQLLPFVKNLLLVVQLIFVLTALATDSTEAGKEFAIQMVERQKLKLEELHKIAKELEFVTDKLPAVGEGCNDCGSQIQNIPNKESDIENGIIVFVSFSMPKASLIELSDQSQKHGAILVLRGICQDSFMATKDKILEINPKGLQLDINPELFKKYDIKRVPTFVLVKNGKEVNRLSGNVTLEFAHQKLLEKQ
jgi:conjugal transfer pilus assembly protein TrbC